MTVFADLCVHQFQTSYECGGSGGGEAFIAMVTDLVGGYYDENDENNAVAK